LQNELTFLKVLQLYSPNPDLFRQNLRRYLSNDAGPWGYDPFYRYLFDYLRGVALKTVLASINDGAMFKYQKSTYIKRLREIDSKVDFSGAINVYHMKKSSRIELGGVTMRIPQNIQYTTSDGPKMLVSLFDKHSGLDNHAVRLALGVLNEEVNSTMLGEGLLPELICFDNDILSYSSVVDSPLAEHDEVMEWYRYCLVTLKDLYVPEKSKQPQKNKIDPNQLGLDL
tara:strand:- start:2112 stop:2792 length:681 start_codon:yes stop_codon:yes gene_type:complete